jgi:hypothetical protein
VRIERRGGHHHVLSRMFNYLPPARPVKCVTTNTRRDHSARYRAVSKDEQMGNCRCRRDDRETDFRSPVGVSRGDSRERESPPVFPAIRSLSATPVSRAGSTPGVSSTTGRPGPAHRAES